MNVVATAIEAILGTGRHLQLIGPYIDGSGELIMDKGIYAKFDGIVTEHPFLKSDELAFAMLVPAQEPGSRDAHYIVPLSTLEEMAF